MTLQAPNLDKRRFEDLVAEARARIPRYTPEWTNLNDSDPGMTLVKLHAWMTETILYELNKVPELNYIKFLDLIGVKPRAAEPALTDLKFTLEKLAEPDDVLVIPVPKNTKVAVDDPDLPREVVFETERTLLALNAEIGAVFAYPAEAVPASSHVKYQLVTQFDNKLDWPHSFQPFDPASAVNSTLYLGLLLRPDANKDLYRYVNDTLPAGPLSLYVDTVQILDKDPQGKLIAGPLSAACVNGQSPATGAAIEWQIFTGEAEEANFTDTDSSVGWTSLVLSSDGSAGLTRCGQIVLELPAGATQIDPIKLKQPGFWDEFGQPKPPQTKQELVDLLAAASLDIVGGLADYWEAMGVAAADLEDFVACEEDAAAVKTKVSNYVPDIDPSVLTAAQWNQINSAFAVSLPMAEDNFRRLYWLRARIARNLVESEKPAAIRAMHLNTVAATQGATRLEEQLGRSNGRPSQQFTLAKKPVLIDPQTHQPDLELSVSATGAPALWLCVDDFFKSGADSPHYLLDPETGTITFGDGRRGRIPVANDRVTAIRYRVGGGDIGNVSEGVVSKIKGRLRNVKSATNIRPAHDGRDAETLDDVKLRAPHDIRSRDRAVSAQDFADLAMATPGVSLHSASPLAHTSVISVAADGTREFAETEGAVSLIIVPKSSDQAPQPTEEQLEAVCKWLAPRRLITTQLHVTGPNYARITDLTLKLSIREEHDITTVIDEVYAALLRFLHPINGGHDRRGWPFGEDIFYGDLYGLVLGVEGVRRASGLSVSINGTRGNSNTDIAALAAGYLPELTRDAINLVTSYA